MNANETSTERDETPAGSLTAVGAELAAARQQKEMSLEAAAAALHLGPEMLRALEAGDEKRLPGQAFVRGYVKSYARLLGLDEVAMAARLPDASAQRVTPLKRVGMRRRGVSLPIGKWLGRSLALLAVLVVLVFAAPLLERLWTEEEPPAFSDSLQVPQLEYMDTPDQPDAQEQPPKRSELPQESEEPEEPVLPEPPAPEAQAPVQQVEPEAPQAAQEQGGPAVVKLRFLEDSWVEMEAHGRKLIVGTQRGGSERTVKAEPPISILVGNAPAVELSYRGEPVDLAPYQRGNIARVTLED
ncbi:MAG: helix-turn-helix domain-containing protein [Thiogranum sp.]|nr:helix-turn-helix domain-containing protein [Thiogranum sp.]